MKKYLSEVLGTFALTLIVALSLAGGSPVPTAVLAGLVLGLFVYSVGHISGTHINPAVTAGLWSVRKISSMEAVYYIVCQFIGAALAWLLVANTVEPASLMVSNSLMTGVAELIGTFFFAFGIAAVVFKKDLSVVSGLVIGGSLLLGIVYAATLGSNGVLNPALALGINSFNLMYVIGPIVGSILGMQAYWYLNNK